MKPDKKVLCPRTGAEIPPGTLYSWRSPDQVKVGEYLDGDGQLVWRATRDAKGFAEHGLAVLVSGQQVRLSMVNEVPGSRPPTVTVEYELVEARTTGMATVSLVAVLEALAENREYVDAKPID